jgi:hypothetical protein
MTPYQLDRAREKHSEAMRSAFIKDAPVGQMLLIISETLETILKHLSDQATGRNDAG